MGCRRGICAGAEGGNNNRKETNMAYWSYNDTKVILTIPTKRILPKERTIKWYLDKINDYFDINLNKWFYNLNGELNESAELEMIMNIIKAYIIYRLEVGNLWCDITNNKIYIRQL